MELQFYVGDLAAYNAASIKGEWLDYTDIALVGFHNLVSDLGYEEWAIHDSNCRFSFDMLTMEGIDDLCKAFTLLEEKNHVNDEIEDIVFGIAKEEQVSSIKGVAEIAEKLYNENYNIRCLGNCVYHPELELASDHLEMIECEFAEQGIKLSEYSIFNHINRTTLGEELLSYGYIIKTRECNTYFVLND